MIASYRFLQQYSHYIFDARQNYNVNIAGAVTNVLSYGSFGYLKDDGIVPSSNYERYSARFKACTKQKNG